MTQGPMEWSVKVGEETTSAVFDPAAAPIGDLVFVCAHGAGGHLADRSMAALSQELVKVGIPLVRFNFLYREKKMVRPDPMPRLMDCFKAVVDRVTSDVHPGRLFLGGRSMGGRTATRLAADGFECDGLILLAYPLHPSGQPEKLRDAHLPRIHIPVLCFNGTRDSLCRRDLMEKTVGPLPNWTQHWLEGADHGFHVLKSSGRTDADVLAETGEAVRGWAAGVASRT
ncbi:MAG: alpha/beta family hydrolase [Anaerolineales bacterium]